MNKTVYIIGAGASKELNLPTGEELKKSISDLLDISYDGSRLLRGDHFIAKAFEILESSNLYKFNELQKASNLISRALPQAISIDNFIDAHRNNSNVSVAGKMAIVKSILAAEKSSLIYELDKRYDYNKLSDTWYNSFFKQITENCTYEQLPNRLENVTLIVFNYDRCIEHFLYHSFINYYDINHEQSSALVNKIRIFHVYGQIGFLPWQHKETTIPFGADIDHNQLLSTYTNLKTFTEGADPTASEINLLKKNIAESQRIVFIGFAFHPLNMEILTLDGVPQNTWISQIYATAYGVSDSDLEYIVSSIKKSLKNNNHFDPKILNKKCNEFFTHYWRSLSYSS